MTCACKHTPRTTHTQAASDVDDALQRLRKDFVVGMTEEMSGLIELLSRYMPNQEAKAGLINKMTSTLSAHKRAAHGADVNKLTPPPRPRPPPPPPRPAARLLALGGMLGLGGSNVGGGSARGGIGGLGGLGGLGISASMLGKGGGGGGGGGGGPPTPGSKGVGLGGLAGVVPPAGGGAMPALVKYCAASDMPPSVLTELRSLAMHDVALYEGVKVSAQERGPTMHPPHPSRLDDTNLPRAYACMHTCTCTCTCTHACMHAPSNESTPALLTHLTMPRMPPLACSVPTSAHSQGAARRRRHAAPQRVPAAALCEPGRV